MGGELVLTTLRSGSLTIALGKTSATAIVRVGNDGRAFVLTASQLAAWAHILAEASDVVAARARVGPRPRVEAGR